MAPFTFINDADPAALPLKTAVRNAAAELHWLGQVPLTRALRGGAEVCYLTAPVSAFLRYPAAEIAPVRPRLAAAMRQLAGLAEMSGLARCLLLGNLPLSTSLAAENGAGLLHAAETAIARHGNGWIGLRNLRPDRHGALLATLEELDFFLLPARVVYEFPAAEPRASHYKRDRALLRKLYTPLPHAAFDVALLEQAQAMYAAVYLERHSHLNPDYTAAFFQRAWENQALEFTGLVNAEGRLAAFAGIHSQHGIMTVPLLGHDVNLPREAGAYRALVAHLIGLGAARGLLFNFSSGAGDAKRKRGAEPKLELTAFRPPGGSWRTRVLKPLARYIRQRLPLEAFIEQGA